MARRRDLFARLSLDYPDHPKIAALSDGAFRAHIEMILYSRRYLTDGVIVKQIATRWPKQVLDELLSNDDATPSLTTTASGDYLLHGFAEMQETRAEVETKSQVRAAAGRRGGQARAKQIAKQTPSKRGSKIQAETETETETVGRARATALPTFWAPTDEHRGRARGSGVDVEREAVKFRAHCDEKGRTAKNWNAAFTRWLMNAAEYAERDGRGPAKPQGASFWDRGPV